MSLRLRACPVRLVRFRAFALSRFRDSPFPSAGRWGLEAGCWLLSQLTKRTLPVLRPKRASTLGPRVHARAAFARFRSVQNRDAPRALPAEQTRAGAPCPSPSESFSPFRVFAIAPSTACAETPESPGRPRAAACPRPEEQPRPGRLPRPRPPPPPLGPPLAPAARRQSRSPTP